MSLSSTLEIQDSDTIHNLSSTYMERMKELKEEDIQARWKRERENERYKELKKGRKHRVEEEER